jgi:hypothetical protein
MVFPIISFFQGTITEILGDGFLAYFNCPETVAAHEAKACAAAVAIQQALPLLNKNLASQGMSPIATRTGIHSGAVLTGNIGTDQIVKFGCLGDSVNLAARLEGLGKHYGVSVICSESTIQALPQVGFRTRKLDLVKVQGKTEPLSIYELICPGLPESSRHAAYPASEEHLSYIKAATSQLVEAEMSLRGEDEHARMVLVRQLAEAAPWTFSVSGELRSSDSVVSNFMPEASPEQLQFVNAYERALLYFQNGHFTESIDCLEQILAAQPQKSDNTCCHFLLNRVKDRVAMGVMTDSHWTGVNIFGIK